MTANELTTLLAAAVVGFVGASLLARRSLVAPPQALMRTNVDGRDVPAVLGVPLALASLIALASLALAAALGWRPARTGETGLAILIVFAVLAAAGASDDLRGDETDRGFAGHVSALRRGRVTGGVLKIVAGAVSGIGAGLLLFEGDLAAATATALLVALGANTINLFDRAPGRAGKLVLVLVLPLMAFGDVRWGIGAAGAIGALLACLPLDLDERAMLGDAGANPLGGVAGLGLALSLSASGRWVAVLVLVAVNAASERWSFSHAIRTTPWLHALDRIGRK